MTQLDFVLTSPEPKSARRHVSPVSAINWYAIVASLPARYQAVTTAVADFVTSRGEWPTVNELCRFMYQQGLLQREAPNLISGRFSELVADGRCAWGDPRPCRITGNTARPVKICTVNHSEETSERSAFLA